MNLAPSVEMVLLMSNLMKRYLQWVFSHWWGDECHHHLMSSSCSLAQVCWVEQWNKSCVSDVFMSIQRYCLFYDEKYCVSAYDSPTNPSANCLNPLDPNFGSCLLVLAMVSSASSCNNLCRLLWPMLLWWWNRLLYASIWLFAGLIEAHIYCLWLAGAMVKWTTLCLWWECSCLVFMGCTIDWLLVSPPLEGDISDFAFIFWCCMYEDFIVSYLVKNFGATGIRELTHDG